MEHLTPLEQQRAQSAGNGPPSGYNSWESYRHEQVLSYREEAAGVGGGGASSGLAWWLTLKTFTLVLLVVSVIVFAGWVVEHAVGYRELLEGVLPSAWIATAPGGDGAPVAAGAAVGGLLAIVIVGLTVARSLVGRSWAADGHGRTGLTVGTFLLTVARTFVAVAGVALVLGAAGIANARDLEDPSNAGPGRLFPYLVAMAPIVWFSIGSTRRAVRSAVQRRVALLEQLAG